MTDASVDADGADAAVPKKSGKKPLIAGLVLALLGGGGGYYAVSTGLLLGQKDDAEHAVGGSDKAPILPAMYDGENVADVRFVELSPLVVSLGPESRAQHLLFTAAIETVPGAEADVAKLEPRILDVMNGYLRALEPADIEAPGGLFVIRAQLTRRLQLVLGEDRMRDLLVMEFVLN
ncbi:flagellar basal body-associated FliL family protein [Roseivivax sp. CAU 1753]